MGNEARSFVGEFGTLLSKLARLFVAWGKDEEQITESDIQAAIDYPLVRKHVLAAFRGWAVAEVWEVLRKTNVHVAKCEAWTDRKAPTWFIDAVGNTTALEPRHFAGRSINTDIVLVELYSPFDLEEGYSLFIKVNNMSVADFSWVLFKTQGEKKAFVSSGGPHSAEEVCISLNHFFPLP